MNEKMYMLSGEVNSQSQEEGLNGGLCSSENAQVNRGTIPLCFTDETHSDTGVSKPHCRSAPESCIHGIDRGKALLHTNQIVKPFS